MNQELTIQSDGHELAAELFKPEETPARGVVLFHGLSNSRASSPILGEINEELKDNGFATLIFDFYGSGESPGELNDKTWDHLEQNGLDAVRRLKEEEGITNVGICARSIGGTVAILCNKALDIDAFVLASTPVHLTDAFDPDRVNELREKQQRLEEKGDSLPGTGDYKGEFKFNPRFLAETPGIEERVLENIQQMSTTLVLATTPDTKVPLRNSTTLINRLNNPKQIRIFEDTDHDYEGVKADTVGLATDWFSKYLQGG